MQPQQQNYWQSAPEELQNTPQPQSPVGVPQQSEVSNETVTWEASEFVHHEKSSLWFLALVLIAVALLVLDYFLIQSVTFGVLIVVMALTSAVFARRPPRTLTYAVSPDGLLIDQKFFAFEEFRAFGVVQEGAFYSIRMVPNKRFMPMVSVFFPTELGEHIVDVFGSVLPMEQIERDPLDKLVEKIRF